MVDLWGKVIAEADSAERVLHAELDWAALEQAHQAIPTGVLRRADLYRLGSA